MGSRQKEFLERFRGALAERFPSVVEWGGGQVASNTGSIDAHVSLRRSGVVRPGERFELGDLRCVISETAVVVEYESGPVALHNLLKYWPYLRGEMSSLPVSSMVLCHFSDWVSYGSYRDLWEWTVREMKDDPDLKVRFAARQFDHWGSDLDAAARSIADCLTWLENEVPRP